jgi:diguanylate cyclase (GGDEF)-like protein
VNKSKTGAQEFAIKLLAHLVVPTFVLDASGRVIIWNRACERLTGVAAADVIGTHEHWRAFYETPRPCLADLLVQGRTDEIPAFYADSDTLTTLEHGIHAANWCVMPRVGKELYLVIDSGPIYGDDGRLLAVVETLRDMTEHKRAQTALENLAARDGLTGLLNRRSFDELLEREWLRARRDARPLALIMIDVDHFKRYNDTYGHQMGDECLRQVAAALQAAVLRPGDVVARYGGEEFVIILPATDNAGASLVAERIKESLALRKIPHSSSEHNIVSVSMGIATTIPADGEAHSLLAAADSALYQAKQAGRNGFALASALK